MNHDTQATQYAITPRTNGHSEVRHDMPSMPELVSTDDINARLENRNDRSTGQHAEARAAYVNDYESARTASEVFSELRADDIAANPNGRASDIAEKLHRFTDRENIIMAYRLTAPAGLRNMDGSVQRSHGNMDARLIGALSTSPRLTVAEAADTQAALNERMAQVNDADSEAYAQRMLLMAAQQYVADQTENDPRHAIAEGTGQMTYPFQTD